MTGRALRLPRMERLLARLLRVGSWVASSVIGLGFALTLVDSQFGTHNLAMLPNMRIVTVGIALFILLPTMRVLLMLVVFLCERDYRYSMIAALVLTIILLAFLSGVHTATPAPV